MSEKTIKKINVYFSIKKKSSVNINGDATIVINIHNMTPYEISNEIQRFMDVLNLYDSIKQLNIVFEKEMKRQMINIVITKINDMLYSMTKIKNIKLHNLPNESKRLMEVITSYKDIVINPNKNPDSYLKWVEKNIPSNYNHTVKKTTEEFFPLTNAVGKGSNHDSYFVHVFPKKVSKEGKNLYLIGKAITFDTGGVNIKTGNNMHDMKVDMIGSAMVLSVLKLLSQNKLDNKVNINLLIPIAENMASSKATKPGTVITSMGGKKVEIINTDAEGRLCMADCIEHTKNIINKNNNLLIDVATLTGNTVYISGGVSTIAMANQMAMKELKKMEVISEDTGEYIDILKLRDEYMEAMKSNVADIANINTTLKCGCLTAGQFLNYFVDDKLPWIHLDVASTTYKDSMVMSHGINLLYEFIISL